MDDVVDTGVTATQTLPGQHAPVKRGVGLRGYGDREVPAAMVFVAPGLIRFRCSARPV
ncbi:hypothetical protein NORO109296_07775 [Nocardiopsis rhodophaea]